MRHAGDGFHVLFSSTCLYAWTGSVCIIQVSYHTISTDCKKIAEKRSISTFSSVFSTNDIAIPRVRLADELSGGRSAVRMANV